MATHGMHNTTLSKPLVVHRVAWVWPVHHQEDGESDVLDEGVEHHNGVCEVSGCHETMVCWSSLCVVIQSLHHHPTMGVHHGVCGLRCVMGHA